jgi:hypothetical protein
MLKPIINAKLGLRVEVKTKIKNGAAISSTALFGLRFEDF